MSSLADPLASKIVETDASDIDYGSILKQKLNSQEQLVQFTSGTCNPSPTHQKYSTIKKEILSIVLCAAKFKSDLLNKDFNSCCLQIS